MGLRRPGAWSNRPVEALGGSLAAVPTARSAAVPAGADLYIQRGSALTPALESCVERGVPFLVQDRGFWDRERLHSLAFNGLNGRGWRPPAPEGPRSKPELKPYSTSRPGPVLVCGQMPGDAALDGVCIDEWRDEVTKRLVTQWPSRRVTVRPHPASLDREARLRQEPLEAALDYAACVVTYSSNAAVEAVIAGVPAVACSPMSMAWPVAAWGLEAELPADPDRESWLHALSYAHWSEAELADGAAAAYLLAGYEEARERARAGQVWTGPRKPR